MFQELITVHQVDGFPILNTHTCTFENTDIDIVWSH